MSFCVKCGQQSQEGAQYCLSCGAAIPTTQTSNNNHASNQQQHTQSTVPNNDAEMNKGMAIIAYIIFFIPLITGDHRKSDFVKYHTNQGLLLFIFSVGLGIAISIVTAIFSALLFGLFAWGLLAILSTILNFLWIVPTILLIIGIINAASGNEKPLPLIGNMFTIIK